MKRFTPVIEKVEIFIRRGEVPHALTLLRQVDVGSVPVRFCAPLANLMRRCGMFAEALTLTHRAIRHSKPGEKVYADAVAEECTILIRLGSVEEAGRKLATLGSQTEPSVLIAYFWYHFTRYEYAESVPLLERWLESLRDPYLRLIGEINLAEAYWGTGKFSKSKALVSGSLKKCEQAGHWRLYANGLHVRARCLAELGEFEKSDQDLTRALQVLKNAGTSDASLIRRQLAINEAFRKSSLSSLNKFKSSAMNEGLWESVRELDFQSLRIQFKSDVFQKLYFGTPYPAYRERILKMFPGAKIESEYIWGPKNAPRLDLASGEIANPVVLLTLRALLRDLYRPLGTRELYAILYPNEEFVPSRSDDRVHQCIARLRRWLRQEKLPLKIDCTVRRYSLAYEGRPTISLRIPAQMPAKLRAREVEGFATTLREFFKVAQTFTAVDVRQSLDLSPATAVRRLTAAVKRGELTRAGSGKNTKYTFS
jgi:tetratricopeptide (TPR) repeat protein